LSIRWMVQYTKPILVSCTAILVLYIGQAWQNSMVSYAQLIQNFSPLQTPAIHADAPHDLDILVYIGESTSSMHMGIYGYPRPTTPHLQHWVQQEQLLVFNHMLSPYTHTSPSLMETLSLAVDPSQTLTKNIFHQSRWGVIDLLNSIGVPNQLFSNQQSHGSWGMAIKIIFQNTTTPPSFLSFQNQFLDNYADIATNRLYDDQALEQATSALVAFDGVSFFHSYAGHGEYCNHIPAAWRHSIDGFYEQFEPEDIWGAALTGMHDHYLPQLECYDSTIRYIDHNLNHLLTQLQTSDPKVLIYFSDHGEDVLQHLGHDSNRSTLPMFTVPFLMHFNQAAKTAYPDLYQKYVKLAAETDYRSTRQLLYYLTDLLGYQIETPFNDTAPLMLQQNSLSQEITSIPFREHNLFLRQVGGIKQFSPNNCVHAANTISKILQGALGMDCLEMDILYQQGDFYVAQNAADAKKLNLDQVLDMTDALNKNVWLDLKNITTPAQCQQLTTVLKDHAMGYLLEFDSEVIHRIDALRDCIQNLNNKGYHISYDVPTETLAACAQSQSSACQKLESNLTQATNNSLFTDLSFEGTYIKTLIERGRPAPHLGLNAWHIQHDSPYLPQLHYSIHQIPELNSLNRKRG
jgi:hypothetical protein